MIRSHLRSQSVVVWTVGWLLAVSCVRGEVPCAGDFPELQRLENMLAAVADRVRPSVVAIQSWRSSALVDRASGAPAEPSRQEAARTPENEGDAASPSSSIGSGVIIRSDGLILTNEHVVRGSLPGDIVCVLSDGRSFSVRDVTSDARRDLAVLRIDAVDLKPADFGDLSTVRQGHFAIVLGNPLGTASRDNGRPAMSFGVISALGRSLTAQLDTGAHDRYYGNLIQTDAPISPGNSGGPLLNIRGEVIGISTAVSQTEGGGQGLGYAIPMSGLTKQIIARLARGEEVDYGFLGVGLRSTTENDLILCQVQEGSGQRALYGGAVVTSVGLGTPAAVAHLEEGDIIIEVDGRHVEDVDAVIRWVGEAPVGMRLDLTVYRRGHRLLIPVMPARRKMPAPSTFAWRGMTLAYPDWEVCRRFRLPVDVEGLVLLDVSPGGLADQAGLRPGQVVRMLGDVAVRSVRKLPWITAALSGPVPVAVGGSPRVDYLLPESPSRQLSLNP